MRSLTSLFILTIFNHSKKQRPSEGQWTENYRGGLESDGWSGTKLQLSLSKFTWSSSSSSEPLLPYRLPKWTYFPRLKDWSVHSSPEPACACRGHRRASYKATVVDCPFFFKPAKDLQCSPEICQPRILSFSASLPIAWIFQLFTNSSGSKTWRLILETAFLKLAQL